MTLEFIDSDSITIKDTGKDEKWIQDLIEKDPSILNLGNLEIFGREKIISSGGRIDFVFTDSKSKIMYETEIQLGATDPSHIIRTIEYWDDMKKRYQEWEHRAVLIAEDITSRFFNVISLFNQAIPFIAIKMNALKIKEKFTLNFITILDIQDKPTDLIENISLSEWKTQFDKNSIDLIDKLCESLKLSDLRLTKKYIKAFRNNINPIWFFPYNKFNKCKIEVRLTRELASHYYKILEESDIDVHIEEKYLSLKIDAPLFEKHNILILEICEKAFEVN